MLKPLTNEQQIKVEENMGLVGKVIQDCVHTLGAGCIYDYDDLFQIGCIGLCKAAQTDQPGYNVAFSTYAYRLIRNEIYTQLEYATRRGREVATDPDEMPCSVLDDENTEQREASLSLLHFLDRAEADATGVLHPCALWYVAQAIAEQGADFVYTDEVTFEGDIDHLTVYHFKPDYMLDNLRSNNYICHLSVFSAKLLAAVGGDERAAYNGSQDYDLYLRLTEKAHKIVHIPHLLYYWRSSPTSVASNISAKTYCLEAAVKALYAHYERVGVPVDEVSMIPGTPGFYKTDYTITKPGRVSILIPSCDHSSDLSTCVESIYRRSTYEDLEIIVIENNSREPATFRCYEKLQKEHKNLKVITWQGTGFNYSALNNFGAREATGEYLLLLNNDTEVISPRWIEEMLMYAQQDRVGCVGAKLLYPDNTIQHAGIGFGFLTLAAHMHKNFPVGHPGYMGRLVYAQDVYAVTAACLMVRRSVYEQVNGLDESFAVAFNDVDFCVRVREAGYTNVFTPFAQLYHYESKSRGLDENPVKRKRFISEVERFQKRWAKQLAAGDPCMNPNFDLMKEDFSFDIKPLE
mgnify:CR=1 FL=1